MTSVMISWGDETYNWKSRYYFKTLEPQLLGGSDAGR